VSSRAFAYVARIAPVSVAVARSATALSSAFHRFGMSRTVASNAASQSWVVGSRAPLTVPMPVAKSSPENSAALP
jgi:hypothetical protein